MTTGFSTPQDAEDAFYDALDEADADGMKAVWDESDDVFCLLPMALLAVGTGPVLEGLRPLLQGQVKINIEVHHVHWIGLAEIAVHLVEEKVSFPGQPQAQPPVYATNVYRKREGGWRMIAHQNSPTPPPPGMVPPQDHAGNRDHLPGP